VGEHTTQQSRGERDQSWGQIIEHRARVEHAMYCPASCCAVLCCVVAIQYGGPLMLCYAVLCCAACLVSFAGMPGVVLFCVQHSTSL
jgi:hypothetical protein